MNKKNLTLIITGVVLFVLSIVFLMPWSYNWLLNKLWIPAIIFVGLGLYLENKEKKK